MKLSRQSPTAQAILTEAPGLARSAVSVYGMVVDTDDKKMIGIDLPLAGAGGELGVFYGWSKARVLNAW